MKPEPELDVGVYARIKAHRKADPGSKIIEIVSRDGVRHARFQEVMSPTTDLIPLDDLEVCGRVRYLLPGPVMRYFHPSGANLPFYGEEFRPEVQLWCARTMGYTPRVTLEDNRVRGEDGSWPEYDTAWFCYFDSEGDKIAFVLAFGGAEVLDEFRRKDGSL